MSTCHVSTCHVSNAMCQNVICQNAMCQNGMCQNGMCQNGMCQNGMCQNGMCQNGMCQNVKFILVSGQSFNVNAHWWKVKEMSKVKIVSSSKGNGKKYTVISSQWNLAYIVDPYIYSVGSNAPYIILMLKKSLDAQDTNSLDYVGHIQNAIRRGWCRTLSCTQSFSVYSMPE